MLERMTTIFIDDKCLMSEKGFEKSIVGMFVYNRCKKYYSFGLESFQVIDQISVLTLFIVLTLKPWVPLNYWFCV